MIDTLLNKLGGLLEKRFLFAFFLPAFCFVSGNLLIASFSIGMGDAWIWFSARDASELAFLSAAAFIITFLLAYILSSLSGLILNLWSGIEIELPVVSDYLRKRHRSRFVVLNEARFTRQDWDMADRALADDVRPHWTKIGNARLNETGRRDCASVLAQSDAVRSPEEMRTFVNRRVVPLFQRFNGDDLTDFYHQIRGKILMRGEEAEHDIQRQRVRLDLSYGTYASIRPTTLGNIVEAYNEYPFKRYSIDGELMWPRLMQAIDKDFYEQLQDKKAFLDFSLAIATALLLTALMAMAYGPFLRAGGGWFLWPAVALVLVLASTAFYRVAIAAARDFGSALRAACDLFRLKLMNSLGRPWPPDLDTERTQWKELSQLAAYGTVDNFVLREPQ